MLSIFIDLPAPDACSVAFLTNLRNYTSRVIVFGFGIPKGQRQMDTNFDVALAGVRSAFHVA